MAILFAACGSSSGPVASQASPGTSAAAASPPSAPATPATEAPVTSPAASATTRGPGPFMVAGLASVLVPSAEAINPSTFTTTFASETPLIYVVYRLRPGTSGKVRGTWQSGDLTVKEATLDYPTGSRWAYFRLSYRGGFIPGQYRELLTFVNTGESVVLPFTVTGPRTAPGSLAPSGTSAFSLFKMATRADRSTAGPDPTAFTDTFPPSTRELYVVFSLRAGLTGRVVCTVRANGRDLIVPLTIDYGARNSWGDFKVTTRGPFPVGAYVATLTFLSTGEVVTVNFTVH